jgi:magnesium transporter
MQFLPGMSGLVERLRSRSKKVGMPPGSLVFVGERKVDRVRISYMDYDAKDVREGYVESIDECFPFIDEPTVTWINVEGLHDVSVIEKIGERFNLHPLLLEDVVNTAQRPKIDDYEDYLFIVMKMFMYDQKAEEITSEQVSFILGPHYVIMFQERRGDVFNPVRQRIETGKGPMRKMGADYLAYALIDAVVDSYYSVLEKVGEKIEEMEENVVRYPVPETLQEIHNLKRNLIMLRKSVWPLRDVANSLARGESKLISKKTIVYLRDVYDHTIQAIDTIETFRDMTSGILDIYLSSISNRMNEVMKVLTIIATIFIPLTFIVGVYGMNFVHMPELGLAWAYPLVWVVMLIIGVLMMIYFRRRKWL